MKEKRRKVNRMLGVSPNIFFIDSSLILPLMLSAGIAIAVKELLNLTWYWGISIFLWPFLSWYIVAGKRSWKIRAELFHKPPRWIKVNPYRTSSIHKKRLPNIRG